MTDFVEKVQKPRILFALLESSYTFSIPVEQVNHRIHSNHCVLMCIDCEAHQSVAFLGWIGKANDWQLKIAPTCTVGLPWLGFLLGSISI